MSNLLHNRRNSPLAIAAVMLALLTGCGTTAQVPTSALISESPPSVVAKPEESASPAQAQDNNAIPIPPAVMHNSRPVSVSIPDISTESILIDLGLNSDGTVEVPPGEPGSPAGWYHGSPTPGERGPAVLLGHVNATDGGPGVFSELRELGEGDVINVTREDGSIAAFRVVAGEQYSKDSFPSNLVYGDTPGSELRLITCDGHNFFTGAYEDNYVVYAKLIAES